ncbi:uncharacterized protein LOC108652766 [Drosophila navojoa]|uniref:uncharacterized protein LOC108652766 n=1 Tax=Drosophila navojoa TaxID=7232 RepID=UPI000846D343|nr:uncharacterized protein LOC108652766 [Drosophila navojoa]
MLTINGMLGISLFTASTLCLCVTAQMMPHMGYYIVVSQVECSGNPRYIAQANCSAVPPRNQSINAALTLMQHIRSLTGTLKVSIPKKNKMHKIFEVSFELCKLLREQKRKSLIEILSAMTCLGNRTIQCPINAGFYSARNITIVEALPPILSESDFLVRIYWFLPKVASVLNITAMGRLYENAKERPKWKKYL